LRSGGAASLIRRDDCVASLRGPEIAAPGSALPMTACVATRSIARPAGVLGGLVAAYAALLPYQFRIGDRINFAPADLMLVAVLVLAAGQLKYVQRAWTAWHYGIMFTLVTGTLVAAVRYGTLQRYEVMNKDAGLFLPFLSYVAV